MSTLRGRSAVVASLCFVALATYYVFVGLGVETGSQDIGNLLADVPGAAVQTTVWATKLTAQGIWTLTVNDKPFKIKGVCYSPTEIGGSIDFADKDGSTVWGDYFWDSLPPQLYNWYPLWGTGALGNTGFDGRDDLAKMKALGINAIRVYFMQSRVYANDPTGQTLPYDQCAQRSHTAFLDACAANGISVLVGIAMPINMWQLEVYQEWQASRKTNINWWNDVLKETATQVGSHPAVMGFTIMNELDDTPNSFPGNTDSGVLRMDPPTAATNFWYGQAIQFANVIKAAAPNKMVGWALHDVPAFVKWSSAQKPLNDASLGQLDPSKTHMTQLSAVFDYYGVNTYQTLTLDSVLGDLQIAGDQLAYGDPSIATQIKPVIFTEIGWSAAGRVVPNVAASAMTDTLTTQTNVAVVMKRVLATCFSKYAGICLGSFWFEYADEWSKAGMPTEWNGSPAPTAGWPNGFADEEAFGLFSRQRSGGRSADSSNWAISGPTLPVDTLTPRTPITDALKEIYNGA